MLGVSVLCNRNEAKRRDEREAIDREEKQKLNEILLLCEILYYVICEEFVGIKFRIIHRIVLVCPFDNRESNVVSIGLDCRVHCFTRRLRASIACSKWEFGDIWIIRLFWKTIKHFFSRHLLGWENDTNREKEKAEKNEKEVSRSGCHLWPLSALCLTPRCAFLFQSNTRSFSYSDKANAAKRACKGRLNFGRSKITKMQVHEIKINKRFRWQFR